MKTIIKEWSELEIDETGHVVSFKSLGWIGEPATLENGRLRKKFWEGLTFSEDGVTNIEN